MARMRRCSARRGGLRNVVVDLDFVLPREREATGAEMASGVLWAMSGGSIGYRTRQEKVSGRCAVSREDGWKKKGCSRSPLDLKEIRRI
jgi:hypothetical protein